MGRRGRASRPSDVASLRSAEVSDGATAIDGIVVKAMEVRKGIVCVTNGRHRWK